MEAKADTTVTDDQGCCPLWRASLRGNTDVVNFFIESGMSVEKEKAEAIAAQKELEEAEDEMARCEDQRNGFLIVLRAKEKIVKEKVTTSGRPSQKRH